MTERLADTAHWFSFLEAAARARFGNERVSLLGDELRALAESVARVLAEPLDFDDEPPADLSSERLAQR